MEVKQKKEIEELTDKCYSQENIIKDLRAFIKWEEIAHNQFTLQLQNDGITINELNKVSV